MTRVRRLLGSTALALLVFGAVGLPAVPAAARHSMSFVPGERGRLRAVAATPRRSGRPSRSARRGTPHANVHVTRRGGGTDDDEGPAAKAVPGGGFKMEDGVLTYPAPARFQPQNLRRHP